MISINEGGGFDGSNPPDYGFATSLLEPNTTNTFEWDVGFLPPGTYMFTVDGIFHNDYPIGFTIEANELSNNVFVFTVPPVTARPATSSTGQALGDPYVYPMRTSTPVKLPNRAAAYCLYVCDTTFINAEVRCATPEHQIRMLRFVEELGRETKRVISDGYFFSKFFVYDGSRDAQLMVDLREKTMVAQGNHAFAINESTHPNGSKDWGGVARNVLIEWPVAQTVMRMTVSFYTNPHIENGVALSVESLPANATGLLVHNYKPKLMRLRSLTTMDAPKLLQRLRKSSNPLQTKDIKSRAEIWKTY